MRTCVLSLLVPSMLSLFSVVLPASASAQALKYYVTWSAASNGQNIQGGVTQKGRERSTIGYSLSHEMNAPRDASSGAASGKRQHKPLTLVLDVDQALTSLMSAWSMNATIPTVTVKCYEVQTVAGTGSGAETNYLTITLTNAQVSNIQTSLGPGIPNSQFATADMPSGTNSPDLVKVTLVYQKVEYSYAGAGAFMDSFAN